MPSAGMQEPWPGHGQGCGALLDAAGEAARARPCEAPADGCGSGEGAVWPGVLAEPRQVRTWILIGRVCARAGRRPAWLKHGSSIRVVARVPEEMLGRGTARTSERPGLGRRAPHRRSSSAAPHPTAPGMSYPRAKGIQCGAGLIADRRMDPEERRDGGRGAGRGGEREREREGQRGTERDRGKSWSEMSHAGDLNALVDMQTQTYLVETLKV